jgi:hypothetical protein
MQVATTRQEHPIRLRRSEVEPGYLLCRLPGNVTALEFGVCPHTRRGQPHRAAARVRRRRKRARQSLLRRHTRRDGVRGWRRGRCTWLGPVPIDTVYGREWLLDDRAKNREACARALQADAFGNMVCPDLRPNNWREVRPGFTPYLETKLKGREWYLNPSHLHSRRFECGISICFMLYSGAQSMSVGEYELSAPVAAPERIVKFCGGTGRI